MKSFNSLMVGVVPIQLPQSHSVQRNEDCTGWDLTPQEKRAGGYFQQQNATIEWKKDQRQDPTQFSCQDEILPNTGGDEAAAEM